MFSSVSTFLIFLYLFFLFFFFFFNDTATTEIYTLSLHDALPISHRGLAHRDVGMHRERRLNVSERRDDDAPDALDRKSTRLNSSHANISYAVFCLKKKKNNDIKIKKYECKNIHIMKQHSKTVRLR